MGLPMRHEDAAIAQRAAPDDEEAGSGTRHAEAGRTPRWRRRWFWLATVIVAVAATVIVVATLLGGEDDQTDEASVTPPAATVQVEQRDLVSTTTVDGTLGFGDTLQIAAGTQGTLTASADVGDTIELGDELFRVDEIPVALLFGTTPPYRTLEQGVSGDDVRDLESSLALLGYDADARLTVDGDFDARTADALEAWQDDVGITADAALAPSEYRVAVGPLQVTSRTVAPGAGVQRQTAVLEAVATDERIVAVTRTAGEITGLPEVDGALELGQTLFEVDDTEMPVLFADEPFDRTLRAGDQGDDVRRLEEALQALGFDADGDLTVDTEFDDGTADALEEWEDDLGLTADGRFQPSQAVVVPVGTTVADVIVEDGDDVRGFEPVVELRASTRRIDAELPVDREAQAAAGDTVEVELPDATTVTGVVDYVGAIARPPASGDDSSVLDLRVTLGPTDNALVSEVVEAPVDVRVADEVAQGALVVPVGALVALQEGGYALEVVDGNSTRLVGVETGMFADDAVEITGDVQAGMTVVVPR